MTKRIIPCLDLKEGRVVKGVEFVDLKDAGDPVELARFYERSGADELVLLDITSSARKLEGLVNLVRTIREKMALPLTVGGGIDNISQVGAILKAGADKVSVNTAAVKSPEFITEIAELYGSRSLIVSIDAGSSDGMQEWEVFIHGGRTPTGRKVLDWAREAEERGAGEILLTGINRDGGKYGYDLRLTSAVARKIQIPLIASGGAGTLEHFRQILTEGEADAALAASVFHYRIYSIREVKEYLAEQGVEVRPA